MDDRLNLGCGEFRALGWTNVDLHTGAGALPDVEASILDLPFADSSATMVYCGHVLEHLTYDDQLPRALREIHRVLRPDGELMVVGPDMDRAQLLHPDDPQLERDIISGGERWPGDGHKWTATGRLTGDALIRASFAIREMEIGDVGDRWPVVARVDWQCAFYCRP